MTGKVLINTERTKDLKKAGQHDVGSPFLYIKLYVKAKEKRSNDKMK